MTRPDPRQTAALNAAMSRAVDLSALKARADASRTQPAGGTGSQQAPAGQFVVDATEENFQPDVVERSLQVPVVVALSASWSPQSVQLSDTMARLASAGGGTWILARVDVDANPRIAQLFGVQSLPMVIAVAGGQPVDAFADVQPEPQLKQWVDALVNALRERLPGIAEAEQSGDAPTEPEPAPEDPRFVAAEDAFERGDYAAAQAAYQQILDAEPGNELAAAALTQVRFAARTEAIDPDVVAAADAEPDNVDAQLAAADAEVAGQSPDGAFCRLIDLVRRTSGEDRDRARQHLVELFGLFPADDERVAKARRDLASALF